MSATRGWSNVTIEVPPPFSTGPSQMAVGMLHALPLGIALLDASGSFLLSNDAFQQTVDHRSRRGEGGFVGLAIEEDRVALETAIASVIAGVSKPQECRVRLASRPEEIVVLTLATAPPGWGFAVLVAVRDIREQVKLERQVAQVTKMQAVGQLAGGIAHDFNNILTAVLGLCDQLLARRTVQDPDYDDIEQIRQNGNRAADLVRQLLAFARQQTLRPKLLDIDSIVDGLRPLLQRLIGPGIDLVITPGEGLGMIRVDPGQLEQVIVNLAVNARDAMPAGGTLTIASKAVAAADVEALGHDIMPQADYIAICMSDTGVGIPPELTAKIFEPFFTTKPVGQGTGLGLSTVYGIVKQTGGFIFVAPVPEGGTSFTLYFPAAGRREPAPPPMPAVDVDGPLSGTVLLVEDDRAVRMVVERALGWHGLTVLSAADGASALAIFDDGCASIDVLVSDVVMPGMDGVALLGSMRERIAGLPAVLMSGYAEPPQRRGVDGPGVIFLAKPFAIRELVAAVRAAMAA